MPPKQTYVSELPACNAHPEREAHYDFATKMGPWMYGCDACFVTYGKGLGVGLGQRLVVKTERRDR
jgi:hypothetical protein